MIRYVLGVVFDLQCPDDVLLQMKSHPDWQRGKLNCPGGKIKSGETPELAMSREIKEECNLDIEPIGWRLFAVMQGDAYEGYEVYCLVAHADLGKAVSMEDEPLAVMAASDLYGPIKVIDNLRWLVPLARDEKIVKPVTIHVES